jgi:hypothetical protein
MVAVFCLKSFNCVQKTRARTQRLCWVRAINLASASNKAQPVFILSKQSQKHCRMTQSGFRLEDNALVELTLAGQTDCFSHLMNRHVGAVRKYLSRLVRNRSDFDDVRPRYILRASFDQFVH